MSNRGKGAAVRTAAGAASGDYVIMCDADLEYSPAALYRQLDIRQTGFGMEAEVTGKLLRRGFRPYEVPISYKARSREEGKKLTWRDGAEALWILLRQRFAARRA
jgi:dolichol-phosphate hexosyltransferase